VVGPGCLLTACLFEPRQIAKVATVLSWKPSCNSGSDESGLVEAVSRGCDAGCKAETSGKLCGKKKDEN
jgi:hypothetical protein